MIRELVNGLFIPERSADCYDSLKNVGNRAVPFLVAAVNESRLPTDNYSLDSRELPNLNSPLYRIGDLLAASGSERALVHFTEYLRSEDQRLREYSAWGLGSIALRTCAEPVKRMLASEDRKIRTFAGLRAIGAPETAQIPEKAGRVFGPEGPPEDCDARNAVINAFTGEQVKSVDDLYCTFPGGENIEMLLFLYVAEHRPEFRNCGSSLS